MASDPGRSSSPWLIGPIIVLVGLALAIIAWPDAVMGTSLGDFVLVSLAMGGGAAWLTGKAVARGWGSPAQLVLYCALLAVAVRFCHFALFNDELLEPLTSLAEFLFLLAVAVLGFRHVRKWQMSVQYGWMFTPAGPFSWRRQDSVEEP
ncbi:MULTISPECIES: DUF6867 family protein [unclassified Xanthobacter]|uniref:DUF6867 family protein n=1 Tax=unclassified Xanthobacter TaxID=2623496 RepID=UPI001F2484C7|nr:MULTISPECIES: hypothetical protein [unclassified Xanthobacter]